MKVAQIINENFTWDSAFDEDMSRSLNTLIKYSGGIWKSPAQASFMLNKSGTPVTADRVERAKTSFGVDITGGSHTIEISGTSRWASYGSRSVIPKWWVFVLDSFGIIQKYSIGASGNMRDGARPNPKKAKLEWERSADAITPEMQKAKGEEDKKEFYVKLGGTVGGEYIGKEGERLHIGPVKLVAEKDVGATYGGYHATTKYWHLLETDDGSKLYYTGAHVPFQRGEKMDLTAGIKKHMVNNKGEKVTVVWRPKWR